MEPRPKWPDRSDPSRSPHEGPKLPTTHEKGDRRPTQMGGIFVSRRTGEIC